MMLPSFLRVGLSLLLWLRLFSGTLALKGDSGCNPFMCVNATMHGDVIHYELTNLQQPIGWLAIGWGRQMDHTPMVIIWPDKHNSSHIVISQRFGWGHELPSVLMNPRYRAHVVDPHPSSWSPPGSTRMAFEITYNQTKLELDPVEHLIWAYSKHQPGSRSWDILVPHYRAGFLKIDFSKEAVPPPPPGDQPISLPAPGNNMNGHQHNDGNTDIFDGQVDNEVFSGDHVPWGSHEKLITAHAVLASVGFLIFLPAGSLIARWTRTFTPKWFKAHSFINMTVTLPIVVIGWLLGPMAVISHDDDHFSTPHTVCGVLLLSMYLLQVWLGRYIHRRRAEGLVPNNKPHPPSNILHVLLGISVIVIAFIQVRSGFDEWETATGRGALHAWCHDLWMAWTVIVPVAYLAGLSLLPRQLYQERQHIMPGGSITYVPLPDGADSPLLDGDREGIYEVSGGEFRNTRLSMDEVKVAAAEK